MILAEDEGRKCWLNKAQLINDSLPRPRDENAVQHEPC